MTPKGKLQLLPGVGTVPEGEHGWATPLIGGPREGQRGICIQETRGGKQCQVWPGRSVPYLSRCWDAGEPSGMPTSTGVATHNRSTKIENRAICGTCLCGWLPKASCTHQKQAGYTPLADLHTPARISNTETRQRRRCVKCMAERIS